MTAPAASRRSAAGRRNSAISRETIALTQPVERAILVGAPLKRSADRHLMDEHLEELQRLADTAGAVIVGDVTQLLDRPNPATFIGPGKVDELKARIAETGATLVVFDDELTPVQGKNLEAELGRRVIDRAELILDIFAVRARTSEAKMQVELAQLEYSLPRLRRLWTHLEKFRGGIGVRGPGETQLETDRRLVNHRIRVLRDRLAEVERTREVQRQGRRAGGVFRAALVGYTNAGKSSILRSLSGAREIFVEDRLFATLDPLTREVDSGEGQRVLLTDTVGFIRKLPHHLVASFRATLEETRDADLLVHVIDASSTAWEEQRMVVNEVLDEIGAADKPMLYAFNKTDLLENDRLLVLQERIRELLPRSIFISTVESDGLEPLRRALLSAARATRPVAEIHLPPAAAGRLLAELHRGGEVLSQRSEGTTLVVNARVDAALLGRLRQQGARVNGDGADDS